MIHFIICCAVAVLLLLFCIFYDRITKNGGTDERQEKEVNYSFKIGYFFLMMTTFLCVSAIKDFKFEFDYEVLFLACFLISCAIVSAVQIFRDSFFTKIENKKAWSIILLAWLFIIGIFVVKIINKVTIERIILLSSTILCLLIILASLLIKRIVENKKD